MVQKYVRWSLLLLLPLSLAYQNASPRALVVQPGNLGEMGRIYAQDFSTPVQDRGFKLLKAGRQDEARAIFAAGLKTDPMGLNAVGLAQATPPDAWPNQIKALAVQQNRNPNDTRLAFRLGLLMYYDSVSHSRDQAISNHPDREEFNQAANLLVSLWNRTHDPLTGMLLTEMSFRSSSNNMPRTREVLDTLVGVVGGSDAQRAFLQARRLGFTLPPPNANQVPKENRRLLVGVLTALWSEARRVVGPVLTYDAKGRRVDANGNPLPPDQQAWHMPKLAATQQRELTYIDQWIRILNPKRGKYASFVSQNP